MNAINTDILSNILKKFNLTQKDVDTIKTETRRTTIYLNRGNGCIWATPLRKGGFRLVWQNSWHKEQAALGQ